MKILFLTNNMPFSIAIRAITSCKWSHCAVAFDDFVVESRFGGVTHTSLAEFKSRGEYHIVDLPLEDEDSAKEFAINQIGKSYDFKGIFGFFFNRKMEDDKKWYCSELVNEIAKKGGVKIVRDGLKGVSPRDLWVLPL